MRKLKQKYKIPRNYSELGEYLRDLRLKSSLTQRDVSETLGYSSAQFISNFERGISSPPLKKLSVMQKLYKADVEQLIKLSLTAERKRLRAELQ
jgi:transcriptional regulator with XRE-family HTH domain